MAGRQLCRQRTLREIDRIADSNTQWHQCHQPREAGEYAPDVPVTVVLRYNLGSRGNAKGYPANHQAARLSARIRVSSDPH